ncbi:MAG: glycoside hydrolase family 26 protein [Streptosporangiaceae bacterium]
MTQSVMRALLTMVHRRAAECAGQAGVAAKAPRRRAAGVHPCLAIVGSLVCAVAVFGTANLGAVPAGAAMARAHAPAMARLHAAAMTGSHPLAKAGPTAGSMYTRSGLPWASGAYLPADTPAAAAAFGAWRKRPLDIAEVWSYQSTWASITDPAWLYQRWTGAPYSMVFSVAMLPVNVPGVSIQACAGGTYNAYWRRFGQVISSYGLGSSIIRLGWEFNGNWYPWAATNPGEWVQCWRQAVTSAWSTAPRLRWDWNVNRGISSALADPAQAYPGNRYVSMIGIDSYDWWPAVSAGGWYQQLDGTQGLNYWLAFAKAHGKRLSVPEWGSIRYGETAGGDDPRYVEDMRAFFAANARYVAFETIFQGAVGNYESGHSMPAAARAYKAAF